MTRTTACTARGLPQAISCARTMLSRRLGASPWFRCLTAKLRSTVTETGARPGSQTRSLAHDFKKILKEKNMKKLLVLAVAFSVMVVVCSRVSAIAQDNSGGQTTPAAPLKVIKGTIKADGEKISFVSDEDKKSWDIINPEAVKGHE